MNIKSEVYDSILLYTIELVHDIYTQNLFKFQGSVVSKKLCISKLRSLIECDTITFYIDWVRIIIALLQLWILKYFFNQLRTYVMPDISYHIQIEYTNGLFNNC